MTLIYITGNEGKYQEYKAAIPNIEKLDLDLAEMQTLDREEIARYKIQDALRQKPRTSQNNNSLLKMQA